MYQKALPVLSNMADNPAISSLQLLTIVYYVILWQPRDSAWAAQYKLLPGNHFVALGGGGGGGGGRKFGA